MKVEALAPSLNMNTVTQNKNYFIEIIIIVFSTESSLIKFLGHKASYLLINIPLFYKIFWKELTRRRNETNFFQNILMFKQVTNFEFELISNISHIYFLTTFGHLYVSETVHDKDFGLITKIMNLQSNFWNYVLKIMNFVIQFLELCAKDNKFCNPIFGI